MMDELLKNFTEEELRALQAGDLTKVSESNLLALQQALAVPTQAAAAPAPTPAVPTQRLRTGLLGASLGTSDEIEAALTAPFTGRTFEQQRQNIMGKVKAYQKDQPLASLGYEALGGLAPGIALAPYTGGTSLSLTIPSLLRTAGVSGVEGGVTGFMSGEGDVFERAARVPQAALTAAVAGPAAQTFVKGATGLATGAVDFARRKLGLRPAKAVEAEIQRLATESGMTPDELVAAIGRGEIMAENKTLTEAVRGLYTMGGKASETIRSGFEFRPSTLRATAMKDVQKGLAPDGRSNIMMQNRMDEEAIKAAERAMYQSAYQQGGVVTAPLLDAFSTAMRRSPKSSTDIGDYYRASTGKEPFFKVSADGNVEYGRTPTLEDMEIVRRGIKQEVDKAYRSGAGATGEALGALEKQLRAQIDLASPAVAGARTQAKTVRTNAEAFTEGRQALSKSADEVEVMFSRMNPGQIKAFRNGLMDALRSRAATGSRFSMMRNLANEETKEGQILRMVYPGDMLDNTLASIQRSVQSKAASDRILSGSPTASSLKQADRFGMGVSADDVRQSLGGDAFALYRTLRKVVNLNTPNLTEKQRDDIAKVLVSTNPDVVRRALTDDSAMTALLNAIRTGGARLSSGAASSAAQISGNRYQQGQ
jgi:hypothetical protein